MTPEQEQDLANIKGHILSRIDAKYRRGQVEHGGNLWDRNPVSELEGEIVDAVTYFYHIRERFLAINNLVVEARQALSIGDFVVLQACLDRIYHLTYENRNS